MHEIFCYRNQDYAVECEVNAYTKIAPLQYEIFKFITLNSEIGEKPNEISADGFDGLLREEEDEENEEEDGDGKLDEANDEIVTPWKNTTVNDPPLTSSGQQVQ